MSTVSEAKWEHYEKLRRWRKTGHTYIEKAVAMATYLAGHTRTRDVAANEADAMMWGLLWSADSLVGLLNDDEVPHARERAQALAKKLRARELAAKLANTTGRTPEETALFERKARDLSA